MAGPRGLSVLLLLATLHAAVSQEAYPQSAEYIPLRYDLDLGGTVQIATVEGATAQVLDIDRSQFSPGKSAKNVGFVRPSGTHFELNGSPWYCAGTNAYYAALKWIMSDGEVAAMMKEHADRGATVLRVFAFSFFDSVPEPMMPDFGVYNEAALRRLDLTMAEAAKNGIRLIMVMSNYWPFLGSMQQWVDRALGKGKSYTLFYTDSKVKQYYKDWLKTIITRKNTLTGQLYSEDPTVLAWELANEPRVGDNYEKKNGLVPGRLICNWVKEMSNYIKSLDSNHMVSVGDEGMRTNGSTKEPHSWLNTGYEGVDFDCNLAAPSVSFGTIHVYPDSWGIPPNDYEWLRDNYLNDRAAIARALGKPLILEEYGMRAQGYLPSREPLFNFLHEAVNAADYACALVWAVSHYSTEAEKTSGNNLFGSNDGQGYVFGYDGDGGAEIQGQYYYMNKKTQGGQKPSSPSLPARSPPSPPLPRQPSPSSPPLATAPLPDSPFCTDVSPPGDTYTCAEQKRYGKCSAPFMQGYCLCSCAQS